MRKLFLIPLLLIVLSFKIDKDGPWIENKLDNIVLYTRPIGFSKTPSPETNDINRILVSQLNNCNSINSIIETKFNSTIKIYLYNYDEAKKKIGTNTGGGANTKLKEIYFTFDTAIMRIKDDLLGNHELAHIIASNELSHPATKLMNEGYANALSNGYAGKSLEQFMKFHTEKNNILTPTEMLVIKEYKEYIFYPQAGYFIKWLFDNYGVENINKIYPLTAKQIKKEIFKLTGKKFADIEYEYMKYIQKFK